MLLKIPGQTESQYLRLYEAALKGDWQVAESILTPDVVDYSIKKTRETVLHIASASKHIHFVEEMVRFLTPQQLELTNMDGDTALCFAAKLGSVTIAKEMVKKNKKLPLILSSEKKSPLHIAALRGRKDMVSYLFRVTSLLKLDPNDRMEILVATITHDMYGMPHNKIILSLRQLFKIFIT